MKRALAAIADIALGVTLLLAAWFTIALLCWLYEQAVNPPI